MIDRIFAVLGAFLFSQFPQFYTQYLQQMSGHIAELIYQVSLIEHSAELSHKSLSDFIAKFLQSSDPDFARQGELMQGMVNRLAALTTHHNELEHASMVSKPFQFLRYADGSIAHDAFKNFQFGFTFSLEGIIYALIGLFTGYLFFKGIRSIFRRKDKDSTSHNDTQSH